MFIYNFNKSLILENLFLGMILIMLSYILLPEYMHSKHLEPQSTQFLSIFLSFMIISFCWLIYIRIDKNELLKLIFLKLTFYPMVLKIMD